MKRYVSKFEENLSLRDISDLSKEIESIIENFFKKYKILNRGSNNFIKLAGDITKFCLLGKLLNGEELNNFNRDLDYLYKVFANMSYSTKLPNLKITLADTYTYAKKLGK